MVFNDRKGIPVLRHFARWVNRPRNRRIPWNEYKRGDSQKWIKRGYVI